MFTACNATEKHELTESVKVYMKIKKQRKSAGDNITGDTITAKDIKDGLDELGISEKSCMFMQKITGTAAFWKSQLWDVLARVKF